MHEAAYYLMRSEFEAANVSGEVLDVGSLNVNGTYRSVVEETGCKYCGLDIVAGPNVDVVAADPYKWPFDNGEFAAVISGSTMEHVKAIWLWLPECVRVLAPGGRLIIVTHWQFIEHKFPVDCWRIMPDGMEFLFNETGALMDYDIRIVNSTDILGAATKI